MSKCLVYHQILLFYPLLRRQYSSKHRLISSQCFQPVVLIFSAPILITFTFLVCNSIQYLISVQCISLKLLDQQKNRQLLQCSIKIANNITEMLRYFSIPFSLPLTVAFPIFLALFSWVQLFTFTCKQVKFDQNQSLYKYMKQLYMRIFIIGIQRLINLDDQLQGAIVNIGIIIDSTMGLDKKKIQVKRKIKVLSKRDKAHKRVMRVHKAVERKRKERTLKKKKASLHRRKLAATEQNQIVQMAPPQQQLGNVSEAEMGLLEILGFGPDESHADWENALQRKLKEIQEKSLDNPEVRRVYGEIGKIFNRYRSGKVPKAFKIIPNLERWREVLALTRPNEWTSQAMAQAVNIFASNFDPLRAQEFYKTWLVPSVRRDLANNKKLNVHLYDSLKKALYKTNAWFKGVMFELCDQHTTSKEVKVIESILSKMSIPVISASVAMLKLMDLPFSTPAIHYLSALLNKHYTLPKRVLTRLSEYLLSFMNYEGELSVAWHCLLLTLAKQYSQSLDEMAKSALADLAKQKNHKLITPQILKHLQ